jgi:hypothetical protein
MGGAIWRQGKAVAYSPAPSTSYQRYGWNSAINRMRIALINAAVDPAADWPQQEAGSAGSPRRTQRCLPDKAEFMRCSSAMARRAMGVRVPSISFRPFLENARPLPDHKPHARAALNRCPRTASGRLWRRSSCTFRRLRVHAPNAAVNFRSCGSALPRAKT